MTRGRSHASHPWHDLDIGPEAPKLVFNLLGLSQQKGLSGVWQEVDCCRNKATFAWLELAGWLTLRLLAFQVNAVVEISRGSKVKYELDKATGMVRILGTYICSPDFSESATGIVQ